jgi:hypothetical protein
VPPFEEKPFRTDGAASQEPAEIFVRMGHPQVRAHVVPISGKTGELTKHDFVTSFLVAWQPFPTPPAHWVELLRKAPFGTQAVRARDLHWDGHSFSIELIHEADIEAFSVEMPDGWRSPTPSTGGEVTRRRKRRWRRPRSEPRHSRIAFAAESSESESSCPATRRRERSDDLLLAREELP